MTKCIKTPYIDDYAVSQDHIVTLVDKLRQTPYWVPIAVSPQPSIISPEDAELNLGVDTWYHIGDVIGLQTTERADGFCSLRGRCNGNGTTYFDLISIARRRSDLVFVVLDAASAQASANGATVDLDVTLAIDGMYYDTQYFAYRTQIYGSTVRRFTAHQRIMKK